MRPPRTSRITHDPSDPASSTDPEAPSANDMSARLAVRIAVSVSHLYSTAEGMSVAGSICTVTFTRSPYAGVSDGPHSRSAELLRSGASPALRYRLLAPSPEDPRFTTGHDFISRNAATVRCTPVTT